MITQMSEDLELLAKQLGVSREEGLAKLKDYYDGYHFTWPSPDIYNPFSLLCAFKKAVLKPFWFESGTPTYLLEMLRKFNIIEQMKNKNITPLLYQSGYITITCYDENNQLYSLDIPNKEVRLGLMENLLDAYLDVSNEEAGTAISLMSVPLRENNLEEFFKQLRTFNSCARFCPQYPIARIPIMRDIISRFSISYFLSWDIMPMWRFGHLKEESM